MTLHFFKSGALVISACTLLLCIGAFAQTRAAPNDGPALRKAGSTRLAINDGKFLADAAMGAMAEVELGKLAQQKAASNLVKQFGGRMVTDHGQTNDELKQIAESKGVTLPSEPDPSKRKELDKLANLSGAAFDREYMAHMLEDHRKDVAQFRQASESAKDDEVRAFASKTLPTLEDHLKQAQSVNQSASSPLRP
jgi:putative membrane protein